MRVQVRIFARFRELTNADSVSVDLPPGATVEDLRRALAEAFPTWIGLLERSALAVDNKFADGSLVLTENSEVALIPPVSGG
jgi:molybdopterin synthase catalytic subunit